MINIQNKNIGINPEKIMTIIIFLHTIIKGRHSYIFQKNEKYAYLKITFNILLFTNYIIRQNINFV